MMQYWYIATKRYVKRRYDTIPIISISVTYRDISTRLCAALYLPGQLSWNWRYWPANGPQIGHWIAETFFYYVTSFCGGGVSICPSVCPSHAGIYSKVNDRRRVRFWPPGSPGTVVFFDANLHILDPSRAPLRGLQTRRGRVKRRKIEIFDQ